MNDLVLEQFPLSAYDKLRYADTDRQGHVNNAMFNTFLETGRVELLYHPDLQLLSAGGSFVIASLQLQFEREVNWPGTVDIGTGVMKIGSSSLRLYQKLYQHGKSVASAETVIVQVADGKSMPLSDAAKEKLQQYLIKEQG